LQKQYYADGSIPVYNNEAITTNLFDPNDDQGQISNINDGDMRSADRDDDAGSDIVEGMHEFTIDLIHRLHMTWTWELK
jgi:hypothetical protein